MKFGNAYARIAVAAVAVGAAILPFAAFALPSYVNPAQVPPPTGTGPITTINGALLVFNQWSIYLAWAFWIVAIVMVFYAAFLYLTSGGDEDRAHRGRQQLIYAIIAMVIGIMAYALPLLITSILLGV